MAEKTPKHGIKRRTLSRTRRAGRFNVASVNRSRIRSDSHEDAAVIVYRHDTHRRVEPFRPAIRVTKPISLEELLGNDNDELRAVIDAPDHHSS